jgi:tetratricopeptide (TPR) repeat protein
MLLVVKTLSLSNFEFKILYPIFIPSKPHQSLILNFTSRLLLVVSLFLLVGPSTLLGQTKLPQTYALIMGIEKYQDVGIKPLQYATRDAKSFADQLKLSGVPDSNIRLLTDEAATSPAAYDGLKWLLSVVQEKDLVYIYFSGHGDVENELIYKLGFLLTSNTFRNNYIYNALSIEHLNYYANTLSATNKARVVLITDACHSGKLAGASIRGSQLVGEQLMKTVKNETRLASCTPEQKSLESDRWAGGRSVFSYYLLKAFQGHASNATDTLLTLSELKAYLEKSLKNDEYLKELEAVQTPVVKGPEGFTFPIKRTDSLVLSASRSPMKPLPKPLQWFFFREVKNQLKLKSISLEELFPFIQIHEIKDNQDMVTAMIDHVKTDADSTVYVKLTELNEQVKKNGNIRTSFFEALVTLLSNRGDEIINLYLAGNEVELERYRYYHLLDSNFTMYPSMYAIALSLCSNAPMKEQLTVKYHYFKALDTRLTYLASNNKLSLLDTALHDLHKAFAVNENIPFVNNDIGIIHSLKGNLDSATAYFLRAKGMAPTWVQPRNYLASVYLARKKNKEARQELDASLSLQPDHFNTLVLDGEAYVAERNFLYAEECFRSAIKKNSRHFYPFDQLAKIYLELFQFHEADSFFTLSDQRKKGFNFNLPDPISPINRTGSIRNKSKLSCASTNYTLHDHSIIPWFMLAYSTTQPDSAIYWYKKILAKDPDAPLVHHYLGIVYFQQKKYVEAELAFKQARNHGSDSLSVAAGLKKYQPQWSPRNGADSCAWLSYGKLYYDSVEDEFYLAQVYTDGGWHPKAESIYLNLLRSAEENYRFPARYGLWKLYGNLKRYDEEERIIESISSESDKASYLNSFYRRVTILNPTSSSWFYRAGNFCYHYARNRQADGLQDPWDKNTIPDDADLPLKRATRVAEDVVPDILDEELQDRYRVPGIGTRVEIPRPVEQPKVTAIRYFRMADSLSNDPAIQADCCSKLAWLYTAMDRYDSATYYYQRLMAYQPNDVGSREQLVLSYLNAFQYRKAVEQFDTLHNLNGLRFEHLMPFASLASRRGDTGLVDSLLNRMDALDSAPSEVLPIRALHYWLRKNYTAAHEAFTELGKTNPDNEHYLYALARISAAQGKESQALKYLQEVFASDWKYKSVVNQDPIWNDLRKNPKWKKIVPTP